jgi:hypothetical protein
MFLLVAMRGNQVGAMGRAIERNLTFSAAAWRTDFLAFRRTKSLGPSFAANCTEKSFCHFVRSSSKVRENASVYPMGAL